jgi:hypothetical protein
MLASGLWFFHSLSFDVKGSRPANGKRFTLGGALVMPAGVLLAHDPFLVRCVFWFLPMAVVALFVSM